MNEQHDDGAERGIAERGESDPIADHVFPPWSPQAKYRYCSAPIMAASGHAVARSAMSGCSLKNNQRKSKRINTKQNQGYPLEKQSKNQEGQFSSGAKPPRQGAVVNRCRSSSGKQIDGGTPHPHSGEPFDRFSGS
jgi:hypothetical protein